MHVELLYHTPDPERAIATAARLCYAPVGAAELMETMPEERVRSVLSTIMGSGHFSTLEHASYTFAVDGVSRALTHQLVRHRIASFNQQSQRYVKFTDGLATVKPESIAADPDAEAVFDQAIEAAIAAYEKLLAAGVPAEDARYLLPNAAETKIVITMNVPKGNFILICVKNFNEKLRCKLWHLQHWISFQIYLSPMAFQNQMLLK